MSPFFKGLSQQIPNTFINATRCSQNLKKKHSADLMKATTQTYGPSHTCPHMEIKTIIFIQLTSANPGTIYLIDFINI